jgi:hypothetical protein
MMLDYYGVSECNWREAMAPNRTDGHPSAPAAFAESESPRYKGRGIAALTADPDRMRFNQKSVTSAQWARAYAVTDVDGSRPDSWAG